MKLETRYLSQNRSAIRVNAIAVYMVQRLAQRNAVALMVRTMSRRFAEHFFHQGRSDRIYYHGS